MNFFSFEMNEELSAGVRVKEATFYKHTSDTGLSWYVPVSCKLESDGPVFTKPKSKFRKFLDRMF